MEKEKDFEARVIKVMDKTALPELAKDIVIKNADAFKKDFVNFISTSICEKLIDEGKYTDIDQMMMVACVSHFTTPYITEIMGKRASDGGVA